MDPKWFGVSWDAQGGVQERLPAFGLALAYPSSVLPAQPLCGSARTILTFLDGIAPRALQGS